jgi:hypothetical protein
LTEIERIPNSEDSVSDSVRDIYFSIVFIAISVTAMAISSTYSVGTLRDMGPGFLPFFVSLLIASLSSVILVRALARQLAGRDRTRAPGRLGELIRRELPILQVAFAALAFAVLVDGAGLVVAVIATTLLGGSVNGAIRPLPLLLFAAGAAIFVVAVFTYGLGLPIPMLGRWLDWIVA